MIKRALLIGAVLVSFVKAVHAITPLTLWVDPDGTTYLWNTTNNPIAIHKYQIASETSRLDPAGWKSITDQSAANPSAVSSVLGAGGLTFGEANPGPGNLAEINIEDAALLAGGAKFGIGKPFLDWQEPASTALFFYNDGDLPGSIVPEPSTFLLATMAGVGLLAISRRKAGKAANSWRPL